MYSERYGSGVEKNEPVLEYKPGSLEKKAIKEELNRLKRNPLEIPLIIGGRNITAGPFNDLTAPHDKNMVIARYQKATEKDVKDAIYAAMKIQNDWSRFPWKEKVKIFNKAGELAATKYRYLLNAASILGQGKTIHQAEIDAVCETADYFRYNASFLKKIATEQPQSIPGQKNSIELRGLEGFVLAISPFNFTAIGANMSSVPALMGTPVIWKPSTTAVLSNYIIMNIFEEAGVPAGVINFLPGEGQLISEVSFLESNFAGLNFTGSTKTFKHLWRQISQNLSVLRNYPRIAGETGGKGFIFAHESADPEVLVTALVRGAFEYQGQKCSAASRAYIPKKLWNTIEQKLIFMTNNITMGDPNDFRNFMGAVIDQSAFDRIRKYIENAKITPKAKVIAGGELDDKQGYFVRPTIILVTDPKYPTMTEEIFGPVLSIYVYDDNKLLETLNICNDNPYGLTGSIFCRDSKMKEFMTHQLTYAAGNFYINDKPTGAMVGLQPFGGSRQSGTNEKVGGVWGLLKWTSMRTIKENYAPPIEYGYPSMLES